MDEQVQVRKSVPSSKIKQADLAAERQRKRKENEEIVAVKRKKLALIL